MSQNLSEISIQYVKGVGPARKKLFLNLGVQSVEDLLYLFPRRYEDRRDMTPIAQVKVGEWQTVTGTVSKHTARRSYYTKKHLTEVLLDDASGRLYCVWFNQPYLNAYFKPGKKVVCYGKVDVYKNRLQMVSPEYEIIEQEEDELLSLQRIVPVYPLTKGMSQRYLRKVIHSCLEKYKEGLTDELPVALRNKCRLANLKRSIEQIHFPTDFQEQEEAIRRISFEEFYFFQIALRLRRLSLVHKEGVAHVLKDAFCLRYLDSFPFTLTAAQKRVIQEIRRDMENPQPMLRLLQGDVGSGKTVVALFGCLAAVANGYQAAFMAPTEILAKQHYENIVKQLEGVEGKRDKGVKDKASNPLPLKPFTPVLLTSSTPKKERDTLLEQIKNGKVHFIIGTHSLLQEEVVFKNLSFVVIDEQHKFGVRQRALLAGKGTNPDVLIMTATPIPRTLCLTLYGDLDVSVIDESPKGRGKIKTKHFSQDAEEMVYLSVQEKLKEGRQAYVVYPIIEENEKLDLKAAEEMFKKFQKETFKDFRIGLVHGQMKRKDTEEVMQKFKTRVLDLLVATTVLEVGIDVPNASVMVIEHAERFGLAQLHQLRGRIGRGQADSYCYLLGDPQTEESQKRLEAIVATTDGFQIAQADLEIRGPGKFFGRHQHGLNELKVANPATQLGILEEARKEALELMEADPSLKETGHKPIREVVIRRYPTYLQAVLAG